MRGARYVRLIPWTLQSGSEQYLLSATNNSGESIQNREYLFEFEI